MFSGKTEELIRRLRRAHYARQRVVVYKPVIDDRYGAEALVSHSEQRIPAQSIRCAADILAALELGYDVVGIDEIQFLEHKLSEVAECLANSGVRVIAAGLDMDYRGSPFETVADLMARAEYVSKLHAICTRCGQNAHRSLRLTRSNERINVGATEQYEAVCRRCYRKAWSADNQEES